jgi:hypothetical protein
MAEGNDTPAGEGGVPGPGGGLGAEGRARRGEGDLLSERRARRVAESGEQALATRAEAAEATVRTLEAHVASLQQRLREAEEAHVRSSEPMPAEPAASTSGLRAGTAEQAIDPSGPQATPESELRTLRQREYSEQRLRVEIEERLIDLERDGRTELERLRRKVSEGESESGMLANRIENLRRELAEAEQAAAAERAALRRTEGALQQGIVELEGRAAALQRELATERVARERAEGLLEVMREGYRKLQALVMDLKTVVLRLMATASQRGEASAPAPAEPPAPAAGAEGVPARRAEPPPLSSGPRARAHNGEMVDALAAAVERLRARGAEGEQARGPAAVRALRHKHTMSLIGRWRIARKQRRQR